MSQQDDASFFRTFAMVLGALVLFTIFIAVISNIYSPDADRARDPLVQEELVRQIAPVGQSRVEQTTQADTAPAVQPEVAEVQQVVVEVDEATDAVAVTPVAADDSTETDTNDANNAEEGATDVVAESNASTEVPVRVKAVVATNCAGCHRDGLYGAQRNDDAQAWLTLQGKGLEELTASVINGKGAMLPRAETSLTDEEISLAIQHMIAQATDDTESSGPAPEQANNTDSSENSQTADHDEASGDSAVKETDSSAVDVAAVSADVPANVVSVVDTLCAGCHISGVANAPKFGDKEAWDKVLSVGIDKVLATAIAGKGAMPARGGSQLSDAELRLAIEYMASR